MTKQNLLKKKDKKEHYTTALETFSEHLQEQGSPPLEVTISNRMAEGETLKEICATLKFPMIQVIAWLRESHSILLDTASYILKNDTLSEVVSDSNNYNELNYKSKQAKHRTMLTAATQHGDTIKTAKDSSEAGTGAGFQINIITPAYLDNPKDVATGAIKVNQVPEKKEEEEIGEIVEDRDPFDVLQEMVAEEQHKPKSQDPLDPENVFADR